MSNENEFLKYKLTKKSVVPFSKLVSDIKANGVKVKHIPASFSRINKTIEPMLEDNKKEHVKSLEKTIEPKVGINNIYNV